VRKERLYVAASCAQTGFDYMGATCFCLPLTGKSFSWLEHLMEGKVQGFAHLYVACGGDQAEDIRAQSDHVSDDDASYTSSHLTSPHLTSFPIFGTKCTENTAYP
jgi:hypothetical protein